MEHKAISVTFGRFNPITTGHKKLVDTVKEHAKKNGHDHMIFMSSSHDSKKNPLTHAQKVHFIHKMLPGTNVHEKEDVKNPLHMLAHLHKKGYNKVHVLVGGDRVHEINNLVQKYNGVKDKHGHGYHFHHLEVKSAGERDPDSEGVDGMSASKMREHAKNKKFSEFAKGVPNKAHARDLYKATRKGLHLESVTMRYFKRFYLNG